MAQVASKRVTLDEIWPPVEASLQQLITNLNQGMNTKNWMDLYTNVYNYCTTARPNTAARTTKSTGANFMGEELYVKLKDFLIKRMKALLVGAESKMDEGLLHYYYNEWTRYTTAMKYVNHHFQYLNRHYIKREADDGKKEVYEINILAIVLWREHLFNPLKTRLTKSLLALIEKERNGEQIDTTLVHGVVMGYVSLGLNKDKPRENTLDVYKASFEDEFLKATTEYYIAESTQFINANTVADYMKKIETRLGEELVRVRQYLHSSSETDLINKCEQVLIEKQADMMWNEFQSLLEQDKTEDLTRMYGLLSRIPRGLESLRRTFETHVQSVGLSAIEGVSANAVNDPKVYVETVLRVYKKFNDLLVHSFHSEAGFVQALDKACRRFINDNAVCKAANSASKSPELLARFTDLLLKKSAKNPEESEMETLLSEVMVVFKFIEDKDVFQTFYSKMLSRRLIQGTSASEDMEGIMIAKLKSACGYEYTSKLQRMFTDISLSRDLLDRFKSHATDKNLDLQGVDFTVQVLATGSWPLQPPGTSFSTPKELVACEQHFQKFYQGQHSGRKLNWLHQLSKGEVRTRYLSSAKAGYTLQASTYQMAVLLTFNNAQANDAHHTTEELAITTGLNEITLKSTLLTLLKAQVIKTDGTEDEIQKNNKFSLNLEFKSKRAKININVAVPQQVKEDTDSTHKTVEEDRKLQIQAAVVRIMKMRKKLNHANLISEVVTQLKSRFNPKIPLIKKCIDILIEKEYLERVEGQKDMYSYIA